jgi:tetratricopeptide (TPR) repeat protein
MRSILFIFLLSLLSVTAFAQQSPYSTNNKEAIKNYALANQSIDEHQYAEAAQLLVKAIAADDKFIEAHAQLGDIMHLLKNNKSSIDEFKKVIVLNPDFSRAVYIKIGEMEIGEARYTDALSHLQKYITFVGVTEQNKFHAQKLIKDCLFSIDALQHPVSFKPINMGPSINTAADERRFLSKQ